MVITRLEVERRPFEGGRTLGAAGMYEEVRGAAHIVLDPQNERNQVITHLDLALRAADGRVHFAVTWSYSARLIRRDPTGNYCWTWSIAVVPLRCVRSAPNGCCTRGTWW